MRPAWLAPLLRLSRADRPAGTLLLLSPCLWSLALASPPGSLPPAGTVALFAAGAVLLRGAGCTLNDLADSDVDAAVARTRARPLPSGQVSHAAAAAWCAAQLGAGAGVLLALPPRCFFLGLAALPLVAAYPLAKRVTHWPQALLGVCFAWGVPMGGAAVGPLDPAATLPLFAAAWAWTMVFDTLYAHQARAGARWANELCFGSGGCDCLRRSISSCGLQMFTAGEHCAQDARDDAAAGVHSTALRFGEQTPAWLAGARRAGGGGAGDVGLGWRHSALFPTPPPFARSRFPP